METKRKSESDKSDDITDSHNSNNTNPAAVNVLKSRKTLDSKIEIEKQWEQMSRRIRMDVDLATTSVMRAIYGQLGLLMSALINDPKDVNYIKIVSARVYQNMAICISQRYELGRHVHWISDRAIYIRDIMLVSEACLQRKVSYDTYLRDSRLHMDLCSRGGILPAKPPGC